MKDELVNLYYLDDDLDMLDELGKSNKMVDKLDEQHGKQVS